MGIALDKITGPLVVAGIIALVGIAWRISVQMETVQSQVGVLQEDVRRNRTVVCRFAQKLDITLGDCP